MRRPRVVRMPPQLSVLREAVGRHTGDHLRAAIPLKAEQLGAIGHIGRVQRDEDGQIADKLHTKRVTTLAEGAPLSFELELDECMQLARSALLGGGEAAPTRQPCTRVALEVTERLAAQPTLALEGGERLGKARTLECACGGEVGVAATKCARRLQSRLRQQPILHQPLQAHQHGFGREAAGGAVGTLAVAHRTNGQHLPQR